MSSSRRPRVEDTLVRLERLLLEILARSPAPPPGGIVHLDDFAKAVRRRPKTIADDLRSGDPVRTRKWPPFRRAGSAWVTDERSIQAWLERQASSWGDPVVLRRLELAAGGAR